jgi:putative ABC transport system permease protein
MSSLLRVKLRRDLRATWSRFTLMVVAIAVSLIVFGGVLCAWAVMGREAPRAYMSTEPASATILLDQPVDAGRMAAITAQARTRPGIIAATGRTQFTSEVEVNDHPREFPLQVFVATPDDPMQMAKFYPQHRAWPPTPGEIYIGRDSLSLLSVGVGDTVTVKVPSRERVRLRVADTVYDPSLSPSEQEQTGRAYLSTTSLTGSGAQAVLDQLKIQVADPGQATPSRNRDAIVAVAAQLGQWLQKDQGLPVREIQVPPPYAHPHQWQADSLLLSLLVGGGIAVLLSAILVANMLNGLFTQQIPQIGVMKAVGARSSDIGRLYLAMTLVVATAATLLALAPGVLIGRTLAGQLFGFLGINATSLDAPWWAYVAILATGLGLPPLMALFPLVKTSRTTVRAAIDHRGGSDARAGTRVMARLGRIPGLDRGLLMALRNTIRRPARFALAVGLLTSAGTVFVAGVSLSSAVGAISQEQAAERNWDVDVQLARPVSQEELGTLLRSQPNVTQVEGFDVVPTGVAGPGRIPITHTYPDQGHGRVSLTTVPAEATLFTPPKLIEGRWLRSGETGAVVLNQITRDDTVPDVRPGDAVQLLVGGRPSSWQVVGIVEEFGASGGGSVYVTAEGLAAAMGQPQLVNQLRIATDHHDEQTRAAVAAAVDTTLNRAGTAVDSAASVSRRQAISQEHLGPVVTIVLAIAVAMGFIGGIGLASTMSTNILDRTREFGVLHAIGAPPKKVRRIVTAEGVFIAIASLLIAVVPTLGLTAVLAAGLGNLFFSAPLPYLISVPGIVIWSVLAVLGAVLATEAAASRASRVTVREALAYL